MLQANASHAAVELLVPSSLASMFAHQALVYILSILTFSQVRLRFEGFRAMKMILAAESKNRVIFFSVEL